MASPHSHCGPHQSRAVYPVPDSRVCCLWNTRFTDATPVGAGAEHRPARSRFIDTHDRRHLAAPLKKVRPRISPRPDPIGTGYIRPRLQFLHCVTIIAAVNEWPLQLSVAGWSMQHHRASARRMGGAERYPSIASYGDDGFRRLNPSYLLNLYWSFAASVNAKIDRADNKTGSSDLPVGRFVDRAVESFFRIFRKIFLAT